MGGLTTSCRVRVNAAGDWLIMPPTGQITQIGDAAMTGWGLVAEDDLFVTGEMEVEDFLYVTGQTWMADELGLKTGMNFYGPNDGLIRYGWSHEEITIPVGQGMGGVVSAANLLPAGSIVMGVVGRVTQAPGGGATQLNVGRAMLIKRFADAVAVALGTEFVSPTDGDTMDAGPFYNLAALQVKLTTNINVTVSDMKVRVVVFHAALSGPSS